MSKPKAYKRESNFSWTYTTLLLLLFFTPQIFGFDGRPWIDENGTVTDLININPDPNGEPWIVGGIKPLTDEQQRFMENIPELPTTRNLMERTLPEEVILIDNEEFPPILYQVGGSCGQASGIGYTYSYQLNVQNKAPAVQSNNRAYGFTYNFLNGGSSDNGAWFIYGWNILSVIGAPSVETFYGSNDGGLNCTRYLSGADRWHKSNNNRATSSHTIEVKSMADIKRIKNWMYDLNGTDPLKKGGCVNFACKGGSLQKTREVASGPHAGDPICDSISGEPMDHAATFAGYSDNVAGGAFLLVNTWGDNWLKKGYAWVPYSKVIKDALLGNYVWCVTVDKFEPVFELKAKVTHKERNQLRLQAGFANGEKSQPEVTKNYYDAFNFTGGNLPMGGAGSSSSIEISLDASNFLDDLKSNDATFFLKVTNKSGTCKIENLTLIDYSGDTPVEYPAEQTEVSIPGNDTILIPISFKAKVPRYFITTTRKNNGTISPANTVVSKEGLDTSFTITPKKWYFVDSVLVDGKNLGPLVSAQFKYLTANHTIEPFYNTKDYGAKKPAWSSTQQYPKGTIVKYNGHLWEAIWWNGNVRPGGSEGAWKDLGEYSKPEDDTLTIAFLDYISNPQRVDTLIITTKRIFKGDTTTVVDTITGQVAKDFTQKTSNKVHGYFLPSGSQFYAPQEGVYTVTLFDLRGRLIKQVKVNAHTSGINKIPINTSSISNGTYLMQLSGKNTNLIRKFIF